MSAAHDLHGFQVFECPAEGPPLRSDRDATDLIGTARSHGASLIAIPTSRLDDDFFQLRTRIAGEILQRFVTYRVRVAIVGDISRHLSDSSALRDFVRECNRGDQIWFVSDLAELARRLSTGEAP